jgi:hypothetical protein
MFGLIEDRGIDENDGRTRHPTRRRLEEFVLLSRLSEQR